MKLPDCGHQVAVALRLPLNLVHSDLYSIMKTTHTISHDVSNASLSLSSHGLSVTDTVSRDNVTVTGLSRVQVAKELRWWLDIHACSHDESERGEILKALRRMQESLTEAITKLSPKSEETAK